MKIPEELKILAGRIGNATMIGKILEQVPLSSQDELELCGILPDRQGIVVKISGVDMPFTLLANDAETIKTAFNKEQKLKIKRGNKDGQKY